MKLDHLVKSSGAQLSGEALPDMEIAAVTADSRNCAPGTLFVAIKGSARDGAAYIAQAVSAGAVAVIADADAEVDDKVTAAGVTVLRSNEPRQALAQLAAAFHPRQPQTIVAVTGTAGKTSVAAFARQIWATAGLQAASIGTTGIEAPGRVEYGSLTTPDPVALHQLLDELTTDGVTHAAMEASSHGLDQYRLDGVRLAAGAFTNLGRDHMDYHPSVGEYFDAKMRLFGELLPKGSPAVVFSDDRWTDKVTAIAGEAGLDVLTVGRSGKYLALKRLEHERFRQIAEVRLGDRSYRIEFPLAGDFQIANGLVAAVLTIATGTEPDVALQALEGLRGARGRLELAGFTREKAPCYVDYAHKPDALENMLRSLRPFVTGKLICVFGCGGDRDPGKRPMMGEIATRLADRVIVTDDNPRSEKPEAIRAAILSAATDAIEIGDRREAIEKAIDMLGAGDCLVVAGKGHETGQTIGGKTHPFSDHDVVVETLELNGGARAAR